MKTAILFATVLISGTTLPVPAQQSAAGADQSTAVSAAHSQAGQSTTASGQTAPGTASARLSEKAFDYMRPVNCELAGKLDSKSAKVGDTVVAKTTASIRMADDTVIPRGAKLMGHITDVQAHTSSQADSHLSIAFDRAEWSGGHALPIYSVIQTVTPPANAFASASSQNDDSFAGPMGGAGARGIGGGRTGGGGVLGGAASSATSTAGSLGSNVGANAGGALHTVGQTTGDVGGSATSAVASVGVSAATSATMGVHATGVPGVMLSGDATGQTSGTLSASKRNLHLDSGTQLTIAVSAAASQ